MLYVIDNDNDVTYRPHARGTEAGSAVFGSPAELDAATANWPVARFVEVWNGFAGVVPFDDLKQIQKFTDRKTALSRIWNAVRRLSNPSKPEEIASAAPTLADLAPVEEVSDNTPMPKNRAKATKPASKNSQSKPKSAKTAPAGERDSKKTAVIEMMNRKTGATLAEIIAATGWQPHTVRGFVAGTLGKKMGLTVESTKSEAGERTYRIAS